MMGGVGADMNWFESIIYGLLSGISEFLPISSHAHQALLRLIFGVDQENPIVNLFVHLGMLLSVYSGCRTLLEHFRREQRQRTRREHTGNTRFSWDKRFIKNSAIPMLLGMAVITYISRANSNLLLTSILLFVNGIILFIPSRLLHGVKDARCMSAMVSVLIGLSGSISTLPGISRIGTVISVATMRGADRKNALNWAFLLSFPALAIFIGIDFLQIITNMDAVNIWSSLLTGILAAIFSYLGGLLGITVIRFMSVRSDLSGFSFYCWGASLLTFILYLMVA